MSPRALPSSTRGAAASWCGAEDQPGLGKPQEHPCSTVASGGDGGIAATSSPCSIDLGVLCTPHLQCFQAGFEGSFDICRQQLSLPNVSPRSPWPWGVQGYNSPHSGAALMGKLESFLGEGE